MKMLFVFGDKFDAKIISAGATDKCKTHLEVLWSIKQTLVKSKRI